MPEISGARDYTTDQVTLIKAAFSHLNVDDDGNKSPATNAQIAAWVDSQVRGIVLKHHQRIESAKADAAAQAAVPF
tara:strand:- start:630 stop:857 length:228 start_codon:yes stop_codon:yes gene_type:complete